MAATAPIKNWVTVAAAAIGAFLAILNIQVVNASLADIQAAIGAGVDDGSWVSTSYLVADIVAIPLSGWLARVFSTRRYLLVSAALFLVFSAACAFARNLDQMIVLRALQGFTGGALIPIAFMLVMVLLPPSQQAIGFALLALTATVAPATGPAIAGYLTESWGWQYAFYLNLPPGLLMLAALWFSLERQPMQLGLLRQGDWSGIATMAIGLGALQTALQEGDRNDWLGSSFIVRLLLVAAVALPLFVWIELRAARPFLNLRLLGRRNLGIGAVGMFLMGLAIYGSVFIMPLYLAHVQGYNSAQIGAVLAWTGLPQLLVIPLAPWLMRRCDPRYLIALGFGLFALSNFLLVGLSSDVAADQLMVPNIVRAVGQALVMPALTTVAPAGVAAEHAGSAAALLNTLRNLGGAIGIALLQTFLGIREQFHSSILGQSVSMFDEATRARLEQLTAYFLAHGTSDRALATHKAVAAIGARVHEQAFTMAFGDTFYLLCAVLIVGLVSALLLRKTAA